jgi:hypothetical protein
MSTLVRTHLHLGEHRRTILSRSLFSGLVGLAPLPIVDDWLVASVRRGTLKKLAEARRVDVEPAAIKAIADGANPPPTWKQLLSSSLLPILARRTFRKALILLSAARRADDVLETFAVATLFDHYCARLHVGAAIDEAAGKRLRAEMDQVLAGASSKVAAKVFRRALSAGGRALVRAPAGILDAARLFRRKPVEEAEAIEIVDGAIAEADKQGLLARLSTAVDASLSTVGREYLNEIVDRLESRWRA